MQIIHTNLIPKCPLPISPPCSPRVPSRYSIQQEDLIFEELIGTGAFGEVWKGTYVPQNCSVAIKKLYSDEICDEDLKSWMREIEIHATLQNRFLLKFIGYTQNYPYSIVTAYMHNGSLFDALHSQLYEHTENYERKPNFQLNGTDKTKIAYCLACGMRYLHERRIIHGDLKSPNVLLDEDKLPKICDFGLSRTREIHFSTNRKKINQLRNRKTHKIDQINIIMDGFLNNPENEINNENNVVNFSEKLMSRKAFCDLGTPQWMAPEIVNNDTFDEKIDVYSYGVILWEMLTNSIPFEGMEPFQIVYALSSNSKSNLVIPPNSAESISKLINDCLSTNPEKRPTFKEIQSVFENFNVRFEDCDEDAFNDLFMSINIPAKRPVCLYKVRKASTPQSFKSRPPIPFPRINGNSLISFKNSKFSLPRKSMPVNISDESHKMLSFLISGEIEKIETALDYFERITEQKIIADLPFWEHLLKLVMNCPKEIDEQVWNLMMQFAKIPDILQSIEKVKDLPKYINGKTLELFLYVVSFLPQLVDDDILAQFQFLALRSDQNVKHQSIIILCKIFSKCQNEEIRKSIISFFISVLERFNNQLGGDLVLRLTFSNSPKMDDKIKKVLPLYLSSKFENNAIAAYHVLFLSHFFKDYEIINHLDNDIIEEYSLNEVNSNNELNDQTLNSNKFDKNSCEFNIKYESDSNKSAISIDIELIFQHLLKSESLSDCALDYLARVPSTVFNASIVNVLIDCFLKFTNKKVPLLFCKIAKDQPFIFTKNEIYEKWISLKGNQSVSLFPVLIILNQTNPKILTNEKTLKFLCEVLNFGDIEFFTAICWMISNIEITKEFADKLDACTFLHLVCQKLKNTKIFEAVIFGAILISKLAEVRYSTSYGIMVQHLSRCASENKELAPSCIKSLATLIRYSDLKKVFILCQVEAVVEQYINDEEIGKYSKKILCELEK
ncbi:hypothetical protein TRFO_38329 [Tritrichomonas foetus]|uniref:Protein kinase domain-containing protein n=1 Tax=Tritrichomonas foetus TaxID=1144522 RepID=A0A1J4J8K5_9EUKA|nr:hypothetical protein TRFO_38329 [Tritrichomonas foetus]|eukprot:OHS95522.1 hypothetical protein TRFO_38329 [Tritrichomonas foetus]